MTPDKIIQRKMLYSFIFILLTTINFLLVIEGLSIRKWLTKLKIFLRLCKLYTIKCICIIIYVRSGIPTGKFYLVKYQYILKLESLILSLPLNIAFMYLHLPFFVCYFKCVVFFQKEEKNTIFSLLLLIIRISQNIFTRK